MCKLLIMLGTERGEKKRKKKKKEAKEYRSTTSSFEKSPTTAFGIVEKCRRKRKEGKKGGRRR